MGRQGQSKITLTWAWESKQVSGMYILLDWFGGMDTHISSPWAVRPGATQANDARLLQARKTVVGKFVFNSSGQFVGRSAAMTQQPMRHEFARVAWLGRTPHGDLMVRARACSLRIHGGIRAGVARADCVRDLFLGRKSCQAGRIGPTPWWIECMASFAMPAGDEISIKASPAKVAVLPRAPFGHARRCAGFPCASVARAPQSVMVYDMFSRLAIR